MYSNRGKGEGMLRKMFAQNRKVMAGLSAIDMGMGTMTRNANYSRQVPMRNNQGTHYFRPQVSQLPAKSTRLNDQCFDLGERNRYTTEYPEMNGTSRYSQNPRSSQMTRGSARSAPYHVPVQNRGQEEEYFSGRARDCAQRMRIVDEPKPEPRKVSKIDKQPKNTPKATPTLSAADVGLKGISNFLSPSPWFPGAKNHESSYQKIESENKFTPKYSTFDDSFNKRHINRSTVAGKWDPSTNVTQNFDDEVECLGDFYPEVIEEPVKNEWVIPPELSKSIASGEFYKKVCEAVLEKVLQQLCPDLYKANQKSGAKSFNTQTEANRDNGFSRYPNVDTASSIRKPPFRSNVSQQLGYPEYNSSHFNEDYKKYAPKPLFNQSFRGRGAGRVTKHKFMTKNRRGLF